MTGLRTRLVAAAVGGALLGGLVVAGPAQARKEQPVTSGRSWTPALTVEQRAARVYAAMSPTERIGQLFMAGVPSTGATAAQLAVLRRHRIGNVYLAGNTSASRATVRARTDVLRRALTREGVRPFVSVDQEGGAVQRLTGRGFDRIPSALTQGRLGPATLRSRSTRWAGQLARAGVNLDLAPVADVVPRTRARSNQPIGRYDREYGHTPSRVARHVVAVTRGMNAAGVATAAKHFPGLGRASGNTDFARHVTDPTSRMSAYVRPFAAAIDAGTPFVMVSSAFYPRIDAAHRACFSRTVMGSMLRGDLGFDGVIVSDSFGGAALASVSRGARATRFLAAGGTMVLDTSVAPMPAMTTAVRERMRTSDRFAQKVHAAVMAVLVVKVRAGLIG